MFRARLKTTAPLLVPLLLASMTTLAAPPRGQVIGPATSQTLGRTNGRGGPPGLQALAAAPLAASPACSVYFDATGQLNFNPPPPNSPLTPGISSANFIAGGPAFAHGIKPASALAAGTALAADAGINGVSLQQPNADVPQNQIQGIAYFATDTSCTQSSFSTTLQSSPAGTTAPAPAGTVLAQLSAGTTMTAGYTPSYSDQGTFYCSGVRGNGWILCEVWRVDVTFAFLTNSFLASGAGSYTLTINQVTLSSP